MKITFCFDEKDLGTTRSSAIQRNQLNNEEQDEISGRERNATRSR